MRFLFASNYYPPHVRGGYDQWCYEVATELAERGHSVCVLTSDSNPQQHDLSERGYHGSVQVHRLLHLEVEAGLAHSMMRVLGGSRSRLAWSSQVPE